MLCDMCYITITQWLIHSRTDSGHQPAHGEQLRSCMLTTRNQESGLEQWNVYDSRMADWARTMGSNNETYNSRITTDYCLSVLYKPISSSYPRNMRCNLECLFDKSRLHCPQQNPRFVHFQSYRKWYLRVLQFSSSHWLEVLGSSSVANTPR